jgi:hypothetical protein
MRIEAHPGRSAGPPLGTIFGVVGLLAAAMAAVWFGLGLPQPICPFRSLTDFPCPTCGSTRMIEALLGGDFIEALSWNPLVMIALAGVALWAIVATVSWATGKPPRRIVLRPAEQWVVRVSAVAALLSGWAYLVVQGV